MVPEMNELERLVAIEAIKQLKARYCRYADTKAWEEFDALFTDDAQIEFPHVGYSAAAPEWVKLVREVLDPLVSMHHCHTPEIELIADDEALGTWAMEDRHEDPSGENPSHHGYGHYHERYVKRDDKWLISGVRLDYLWTSSLGPVQAQA
jgi:hypothetical protein